MTSAPGVADAVAAVIAAEAFVTLGGRITTDEATTLARRSVQAVRADGWTITALSHPHTAHHHREDTMTKEQPRLRPYDPVILAGLARGDTPDQIAAITHVRPGTVRHRILRLRRRIGAHSSAHAVALAYQQGWLTHLTNEHRPDTRLSIRQTDALRRVAEGMTNPQIAQALGVSLTSVGIYLHRAYLRLGATGRTHAVALAYQHGHLTTSATGHAAA